MKPPVKKGIKLVSILLIAAFVFQELSYAAPMDVQPIAIAPLNLIAQDPFRFEAPLDFATLKEVHKGTADTLIIHIQDAHANLSGQQNLASALDQIMSKYKVSLVLSEGGANDCSLTSVRKVAPADVWKKVAKSFLIQGRLSGEEYLNLTSEHPMKIMGIEDIVLYVESLDHYAQLADRREKTLARLAEVQRVLEIIKNKIYPTELLQYEKSKKGSQSGNDFEGDIKRFLGLLSQYQINLKSYPEVEKLKYLSVKEQDINFEAANLEQAVLVEEIAKLGGTEDLKSAVEKMGRLKNQKASQFNYFQNTLKIAKSKNVNVSKFTNLLLYVDYLKSFSEIDLDRMMDEMKSAEDDLYVRILGSSQDAKLIRSIDRYIGLLDAAYHLKMTTKEFKLFDVNEKDFGTVSYVGFINRKLAELGYFTDLMDYPTPLEEGKASLRDFYDSVSRRDYAFMANTEKILDAEKQKVAVLIAGGYHTSHLTQLFKEKGYSYAVLTPIVTAETNQAKYERRLLGPIREGTKTVENVQGQARIKVGTASDLDKEFSQHRKKSDGIRSAALALRDNPSNERLRNESLSTIAEVKRVYAFSDANLRGILTAVGEIKLGKGSKELEAFVDQVMSGVDERAAQSTSEEAATSDLSRTRQVSSGAATSQIDAEAPLGARTADSPSDRRAIIESVLAIGLISFGGASPLIRQYVGDKNFNYVIGAIAAISIVAGFIYLLWHYLALVRRGPRTAVGDEGLTAPQGARAAQSLIRRALLNSGFILAIGAAMPSAVTAIDGFFGYGDTLGIIVSLEQLVPANEEARQYFVSIIRKIGNEDLRILFLRAKSRNSAYGEISRYFNLETYSAISMGESIEQYNIGPNKNDLLNLSQQQKEIEKELKRRGIDVGGARAANVKTIADDLVNAYPEITAAVIYAELRGVDQGTASREMRTVFGTQHGLFYNSRNLDIKARARKTIQNVAREIARRSRSARAADGARFSPLEVVRLAFFATGLNGWILARATANYIAERRSGTSWWTWRYSLSHVNREVYRQISENIANPALGITQTEIRYLMNRANRLFATDLSRELLAAAFQRGIAGLGEQDVVQWLNTRGQYEPNGANELVVAAWNAGVSRNLLISRAATLGLNSDIATLNHLAQTLIENNDSFPDYSVFETIASIGWNVGNRELPINLINKAALANYPVARTQRPLMREWIRRTDGLIQQHTALGVSTDHLRTVRMNLRRYQRGFANQTEAPIRPTLPGPSRDSWLRRLVSFTPGLVIGIILAVLSVIHIQSTHIDTWAVRDGLFAGRSMEIPYRSFASLDPYFAEFPGAEPGDFLVSGYDFYDTLQDGKLVNSGNIQYSLPYGREDQTIPGRIKIKALGAGQSTGVLRFIDGDVKPQENDDYILERDGKITAKRNLYEGYEVSYTLRRANRGDVGDLTAPVVLNSSEQRELEEMPTEFTTLVNSATRWTVGAKQETQDLALLQAGMEIEHRYFVYDNQVNLRLPPGITWGHLFDMKLKEDGRIATDCEVAALPILLAEKKYNRPAAIAAGYLVKDKSGRVRTGKPGVTSAHANLLVKVGDKTVRFEPTAYMGNRADDFVGKDGDSRAMMKGFLQTYPGILYEPMEPTSFGFANPLEPTTGQHPELDDTAVSQRETVRSIVRDFNAAASNWRWPAREADREGNAVPPGELLDQMKVLDEALGRIQERLRAIPLAQDPSLQAEMGPNLPLLEKDLRTKYQESYGPIQETPANADADGMRKSIERKIDSLQDILGGLPEVRFFQNSLINRDKGGVTLDQTNFDKRKRGWIRGYKISATPDSYGRYNVKITIPAQKGQKKVTFTANLPLSEAAGLLNEFYQKAKDGLGASSRPDSEGVQEFKNWVGLLDWTLSSGARAAEVSANIKRGTNEKYIIINVRRDTSASPNTFIQFTVPERRTKTHRGQKLPEVSIQTDEPIEQVLSDVLSKTKETLFAQPQDVNLRNQRTLFQSAEKAKKLITEIVNNRKSRIISTPQGVMVSLGTEGTVGTQDPNVYRKLVFTVGLKSRSFSDRALKFEVDLGENTKINLPELTSFIVEKLEAGFEDSELQRVDFRSSDDRLTQLFKIFIVRQIIQWNKQAAASGSRGATGRIWFKDKDPQFGLVENILSDDDMEALWFSIDNLNYFMAPNTMSVLYHLLDWFNAHEDELKSGVTIDALIKAIRLSRIPLKDQSILERGFTEHGADAYLTRIVSRVWFKNKQERSREDRNLIIASIGRIAATTAGARSAEIPNKYLEMADRIAERNAKIDIGRKEFDFIPAENKYVADFTELAKLKLPEIEIILNVSDFSSRLFKIGFFADAQLPLLARFYFNHFENDLWVDPREGQLARALYYFLDNLIQEGQITEEDIYTYLKNPDAIDAAKAGHILSAIIDAQDTAKLQIENGEIEAMLGRVLIVREFVKDPFKKMILRRGYVTESYSGPVEFAADIIQLIAGSETAPSSWHAEAELSILEMMQSEEWIARIPLHSVVRYLQSKNQYQNPEDESVRNLITELWRNAGKTVFVPISEVLDQLRFRLMSAEVKRVEAMDIRNPGILFEWGRFSQNPSTFLAQSQAEQIVSEGLALLHNDGKRATLRPIANVVASMGSAYEHRIAEILSGKKEVLRFPNAREVEAQPRMTQTPAEVSQSVAFLYRFLRDRAIARVDTDGLADRTAADTFAIEMRRVAVFKNFQTLQDILTRIASHPWDRKFSLDVMQVAQNAGQMTSDQFDWAPLRRIVLGARWASQSITARIYEAEQVVRKKVFDTVPNYDRRFIVMKREGTQFYNIIVPYWLMHQMSSRMNIKLEFAPDEPVMTDKKMEEWVQKILERKLKSKELTPEDHYFAFYGNDWTLSKIVDEYLNVLTPAIYRRLSRPEKEFVAFLKKEGLIRKEGGKWIMPKGEAVLISMPWDIASDKYFKSWSSVQRREFDRQTQIHENAHGLDFSRDDVRKVTLDWFYKLTPRQQTALILLLAAKVLPRRHASYAEFKRLEKGFVGITYDILRKETSIPYLMKTLKQSKNRVSDSRHNNGANIFFTELSAYLMDPSAFLVDLARFVGITKDTHPLLKALGVHFELTPPSKGIGPSTVRIKDLGVWASGNEELMRVVENNDIAPVQIVFRSSIFKEPSVIKAVAAARPASIKTIADDLVNEYPEVITDIIHADVINAELRGVNQGIASRAIRKVFETQHRLFYNSKDPDIKARARKTIQNVARELIRRSEGARSAESTVDPKQIAEELMARYPAITAAQIDGELSGVDQGIAASVAMKEIFAKYRLNYRAADFGIRANAIDIIQKVTAEIGRRKPNKPFGARGAEVDEFLPSLQMAGLVRHIEDMIRALNATHRIDLPNSKFIKLATEQRPYLNFDANISKLPNHVKDRMRRLSARPLWPFFFGGIRLNYKHESLLETLADNEVVIPLSLGRQIPHLTYTENGKSIQKAPFVDFIHAASAIKTSADFSSPSARGARGATPGSLLKGSQIFLSDVAGSISIYNKSRNQIDNGEEPSDSLIVYVDRINLTQGTVDVSFFSERKQNLKVLNANLDRTFEIHGLRRANSDEEVPITFKLNRNPSNGKLYLRVEVPADIAIQPFNLEKASLRDVFMVAWGLIRERILRLNDSSVTRVATPIEVPTWVRIRSLWTNRAITDQIYNHNAKSHHKAILEALKIRVGSAEAEQVLAFAKRWAINIDNRATVARVLEAIRSENPDSFRKAGARTAQIPKKNAGSPLSNDKALVDVSPRQDPLGRQYKFSQAIEFNVREMIAAVSSEFTEEDKLWASIRSQMIIKQKIMPDMLLAFPQLSTSDEMAEVIFNLLWLSELRSVFGSEQPLNQDDIETTIRHLAYILESIYQNTGIIVVIVMGNESTSIKIDPTLFSDTDWGKVPKLAQALRGIDRANVKIQFWTLKEALGTSEETRAIEEMASILDRTQQLYKDSLDSNLLSKTRKLYEQAKAIDSRILETVGVPGNDRVIVYKQYDEITTIFARVLLRAMEEAVKTKHYPLAESIFNEANRELSVFEIMSAMHQISRIMFNLRELYQRATSDYSKNDAARPQIPFKTEKGKEGARAAFDEKEALGPLSDDYKARRELIIQAVWRDLGEGFESFEKFRSTTFNQLINRNGFIVVQGFAEDTTNAGLFYLTEEHYQEIRRKFIQAGAVYRAPEELGSPWWTAVTRAGLYYFPDRVNKLSTQGIYFSNSAVFHELLERAFSQNDIYDPAALIHRDFSVLVEEMKFAALLGSEEIFNKVLASRRREIEQIKKYPWGASVEAVHFVTQLDIWLHSVDYETYKKAGEQRWADSRRGARVGIGNRGATVSEGSAKKFYKVMGVRLAQANVKSIEDTDPESLIILTQAYLVLSRGRRLDSIFSFYLKHRKRNISVSFMEVGEGASKQVYLVRYSREGLLTHTPSDNINITKYLKIAQERLDESKMTRRQAVRTVYDKLEAAQLEELGRNTRFALKFGQSFATTSTGVYTSKTKKGFIIHTGGYISESMKQQFEQMTDAMRNALYGSDAAKDSLVIRFVKDSNELEGVLKEEENAGEERKWIIANAPTPELLRIGQGHAIVPFASNKLEEIASSFIPSGMLVALGIGGATPEELRSLWEIGRANPTAKLDKAGLDLIINIPKNATVEQYTPYLMKIVAVAWNKVMQTINAAIQAVGAAA